MSQRYRRRVLARASCYASYADVVATTLDCCPPFAPVTFCPYTDPWQRIRGGNLAHLESRSMSLGRNQTVHPLPPAPATGLDLVLWRVRLPLTLG